ncbi:MAG: tetratricopeptide repeat protein [Bacteroidetes bacterium]|nr:tetratricopeptide repeat protein [Bacteroidota bacterium]
MARIFCIILMLLSLQAFSQQTAIYVDPERDYQRGLDLLQKQKYGAAQKLFFSVIDSKENISEEARANSAFYVGKCASELFNKDAEYLLLDFMKKYPASSNYQPAVLELGLYYYRLKRYKSAIEWLAKVDQADMEQDKKDEVNFKTGYAYYMTSDYDKAGKAFYLVKDGNSKYATAAQYYYAHMAFVSENYETALKEFLKLKDSEAFGPVAPYYITQIYYRQKKYDEVLKYAPSVLDTAATRNAMEISRMVAEAYYRKEDYKSALPYLIDYSKNSGGAGRTDDYEIAFSSYRTGDYAQAITYFQKVTGPDDSLSQNAFYHMADCQLKMNKKRSARSAFQSASKSDFNQSIKEESAFNYAKLSYELSFQSEALDAFRNFIKNFPSSLYFDQANEMLIGIYTNTRNYKDALTALETVKNKTQNIKAAYQKVAYYRGVELFMDNNSAEAISLFGTSLQYPVDQNLVAEANFWSGEANYKLNKYEEAVRSYNNFILTPAALKNERYNLANYNIGYSYFKQEEYSNALNAFRKYVKENHIPIRFVSTMQLCESQILTSC